MKFALLLTLTEATSRNIESRKDVCFDTYQNHSMKGATNGDLEA